MSPLNILNGQPGRPNSYQMRNARRPDPTGQAYLSQLPSRYNTTTASGAPNMQDPAATHIEDMQSVEPPESLIDGADYTGCSYSADRGAMWCRSLTITFTIMLLVWHLVAAMTVEAADHCAFSLLTMYLLRAAGILLPFYVVMRLIRMVQRGQQQYRLQMLEDQRRNASTMNHMHGQEEQQLVISIH
ncbi:hypothetical protein GQ55_3G309300 [Panicum hallii var. hallii]|uniref:Uncharacterized protein n=1 Tax=Panicum hallii var. hallii TaxID=1504633 RepID=A0A2T7EF44_9POAL|nr:hypothetical protein GQ55_3G309300 [Panicum hallii var. hallii]